MNEIDAIKARDATWDPRCQWAYPGFVGTDRDDWDHDPTPCRDGRRHHGPAPDNVKRHIGPENDHPFTYDPARDTTPEADRHALLAMLDEQDRMERWACPECGQFQFYNHPHSEWGCPPGRNDPHRLDGPRARCARCLMTWPCTAAMLAEATP